MEKRKLGTSDVSILGYGCMRFPQKENKIDEELALEQLRYGYDNGINYFDTAWPYHNGESEVVVGRFLKTIDRTTVFIADKMPTWDIDSVEKLDIIFNKQLEKLGTDYIDYYLLHCLTIDNFEKVKKFEMISWIENKKKEGKIRNFGFSFHDHYDLFEEIINQTKWDFVQIQLNYVDENYQAGLKGLNYAKEKGIDVIIMEPLRGGILANSNNQVAAIMEKAIEKKSPVAWALRYLWNQEGIKILLSGMNDLNHIKDNIEIAKTSKLNTLTADDLKIIEELKNFYQVKIKVPCTGCNYCMPCPHGVDIPSCFSYYNASEMADDKEFFQYNAILDDSKKANNCLKCGICEPKCPQNIGIIDALEEVKARFGE